MSIPKSPSPSFEAFSIELVERILLFTSVRDILQLSLVNQAFHKLVQGSPSIQYEIDLFAVGLQRNPRIDAPIADCRLALASYRRRWETLHPVEKLNKDFCHRDRDHDWCRPNAIAVSGVHGLCWKDRVKFFTLGPTSRGIPSREWDIPLKDIKAHAFAFYPPANVMAVAESRHEWTSWECKIQLRTLDNGEPHPSAEAAVLYYTFEPKPPRASDVRTLSITNSRLAFSCASSRPVTTQVIVWDWTTGQILLDLMDEACHSMTFVDDFWLALRLKGQSGPGIPPGLAFFNTKHKKIAGEELAQTTFYLDPSEEDPWGRVDLVSDLGGHVPSHEDDLFAPFYLDPSQRVLGVEFLGSVIVTKTETLLKLARDREGDCLQWREWQSHVTRIEREGYLNKIWISGPRLCYAEVTESGETSMDVYDFGARASAVCVESIKDGVAQRFTPSVTQILPWGIDQIINSYGCHDSMTFVLTPDPLGRHTVHTWNFS